MVNSFKAIKKVDLQVPRSGKGARCATMQSPEQRLKPHVGEIIIYGSLLLLLMAGTYWRNRVWNNDLVFWTDCVKKSPNKGRSHNNLGNVLFNQGMYQEAIDQYKEALRIKPNYAWTHNNLGNVFANQGKYQEAADQYREALRINPNYAEAHYNLGNAYLMIGNRGLALKEYEILKTMNQGFADALYRKIR